MFVSSRTPHKSSKKLYEQCVKLEKLWSHVFTTIVPLTQRDTWYRKLREAIDREQNQAIWISEAKVTDPCVYWPRPFSYCHLAILRDWVLFIEHSYQMILLWTPTGAVTDPCVYWPRPFSYCHLAGSGPFSLNIPIK